MLLNYKKPVLVSSTLGAVHPANDAVDENIKTYWSAATGEKGEWIQTDLGPSRRQCRADQLCRPGCGIPGKQTGTFTIYTLSIGRREEMDTARRQEP